MTDSPNPQIPITLHIEGCDASGLWAKSKPAPAAVPRPRARRRRYSAPERLLVIAPVLEFRRRVRECGHRPYWLLLPDGSMLHGRRRALRSMGALVGFIAARTGISAASLWRWYSMWTRGESLRDRPRIDKGRSRWFARHGAAADVVRRGAAGRCSIAAIHRAVLIGQAPSYTTVRDFLRREVLP